MSVVKGDQQFDAFNTRISLEGRHDEPRHIEI